MNTWYVYMLRLSNDSYYTGITNNVDARMKTHNEGKGSKCVRSFLPFRLVYLEKAGSRSAATKREIEIKKMKRFRKLVLAANKDNLAWNDEWKHLSKKEEVMSDKKKCGCGGGKCCEPEDKDTTKDCDKKECDKDSCDCDDKDCDKE